MRFVAHDTRQHVEFWLALIGEGPLFRSITKGGQIGAQLSSDSVSRIIKRRALAAGIDPAAVVDISGHSARVGAAQDMVGAGLGVSETMQAGGWKSPSMVARYTEHQSARRGAMAKLAAKQNRL